MLEPSLKQKLNTKSQQTCGGLYHYRSFLKAMHNTLNQLIKIIADGFTFRVQKNVDGLPLFKFHSNLQLWPILWLLLIVPMKEQVVSVLLVVQKKKKKMP